MNPTEILIVDDSDLILQMYDLVLVRYRRTGAKVFRASNGQEALETLHDQPGVNLIPLDINMPIMSGLEFLGRCSKFSLYAKIPVIIISTKGSEEDTLRALEAGAFGYITKPFDPEELHSLIARVEA